MSTTSIDYSYSDKDAGFSSRVLRSQITQQRGIAKTTQKTRTINKTKVKRSEILEDCSSSTGSTITSAQVPTKSPISCIESRHSVLGNVHSSDSSSDVQLIAEECAMPIMISSSSATLVGTPGCSNKHSPDLFDSFTQSNVADNINDCDIKHSIAPNLCEHSRESITTCTQDFLSNSIDTANETNPVDALITTTSDIFEITRNNVFQNVLKVTSSASDVDAVVLPVKRSRSCFTGVRVTLASDELRQNVGSSQELIDLTTVESQISLNDAFISNDATEEKRLRTPSTQSCIGAIMTPKIRSGWLSTRLRNSNKIQTSSTTTPRARRRLNLDSSIVSSNNRVDRSHSNVLAQVHSPNIFSSDDE